MNLVIRNGSALEVEAEVIVNAANENLACGGGICGQIFKHAGIDELTRECKAIGHIRTGYAVMTNAYNLKPFKKIIHAVGPIYSGAKDDPRHLKMAYYNSLVLADANDYQSISLPSISTGIFSFPLDVAASIAVKTILEFNAKNLKTVYLSGFTKPEYDALNEALKVYNESK